MIRRFHGIDRHKAYSTISVVDCEGQEVRFIRSCDLRAYLKELGPEDAVVLEASGGSFYWADRIEERGALCFVLDPNRFHIITDSWNKTDRQDSRNMAKALWVYLVTGEARDPHGAQAGCDDPRASQALQRLRAAEPSGADAEERNPGGVAR
jgi:transposase